ncbi:unknown [Clostridium sp. CAG:780]|nr:unknown [Clostridium sp. CAG:780]
MNKKIDQLYEDKLLGIINVDDFERMYISTLNRKKELKEMKKSLLKQKEVKHQQMNFNKIKQKHLTN